MEAADNKEVVYMKRLVAMTLVVLILLTGCADFRKARMQSFALPPWNNNAGSPINTSLINEEGKTILERIEVPEGFERVTVEEESFENYLRSFPLKPPGTAVKYFNGDTKSASVHVAVLDIDVGDRDLQQCADAVMRLRAEYLYSKAEFDNIHFNFTNGFKAEYSKWMQGYRVAVSGNNTAWVKRTGEERDYASFRKYLDVVFAYAGTASLSKEMQQIDIKDMEIGDVFIKGGSPGHCVIVVDMAENKKTGEKLFLLGQSYMPAQDIHILKNPHNTEGNPWYSLKAGETLATPEWNFTAEQLERF
jgi:hypothetical protein